MEKFENYYIYMDRYVIQENHIMDVIAKCEDYFIESAQEDFNALDMALKNLHELYRSILKMKPKKILKNFTIPDIFKDVTLALIPQSVGKVSYNHQTSTLTVPCLPEKIAESPDPRKVAKDSLVRFIKDHRQEVVHELIHYQDHATTKIPVMQSPAFGTPDYYNNGIEFNAYFLSIAYNTMLLLKKSGMLEGFVMVYKQSPNKAFQYLTNNIINDVITNKYLSQLNLSYQKKFLSRLYEMIQEFIK